MDEIADLDDIILNKMTHLDKMAHLDNLYTAAMDAYVDWDYAVDQEEYEAGRTSYEEAHDALQVAIGKTWGLPHPVLAAPIQTPSAPRPE